MLTDTHYLFLNTLIFTCLKLQCLAERCTERRAQIQDYTSTQISALQSGRLAHAPTWPKRPGHGYLWGRGLAGHAHQESWCCCEMAENGSEGCLSLLWHLPTLDDFGLPAESACWLSTLAPIAGTGYSSFKLLPMILDCILISMTLLHDTCLLLAEGGLGLQRWLPFCLLFNFLPGY